ncbi:MAG: phage portal protein [Gammaproteobacteria bacterium]|nr:phage portal protein [Gammaproteobacteria bacterium]
MALETPDEVGSPDWWLLTLGRRLRKRRGQLDEWREYYQGRPPLPQGPAKAARAYLDFQRKSRMNFLKLVIDASVHRLLVLGLADSAGQADAPAWRWWQQNRLAARQKSLYRCALSQSVAYVIGGRHPEDRQRPLVTVEHPREGITDTDPATGEVRWALKAWYDDVLKVGKATLADRTTLYHYVSEGRGLGWGASSWSPRPDNPTVQHGFGRVPVVPFECRPEVGEEPVAEFDQVMPIQDRVNLGMLNRMTAERYSAFRPRSVSGHKFEKQRDAEGRVLQDPDTGLPLIVNPFTPDPSSTWATEKTDAKFGEFSQTDLTGYLRAHEADILDLLITSHTPAYYYISQLINISADTVTALDGQHISKVEEHQDTFGESWEDVAELAAAVTGQEWDRTSGEIRWRNPRHLNPAVTADRATKLYSIGYPLEIVAEDMGESPQRIRRITQASAMQALLSAAQPQQPTPQQQPAQAGEAGQETGEQGSGGAAA